MLGKIADLHVAGDHSLAVVRGQLAHDDLKERRFAGSVDADKGGLFLLLDVEGDFLQDFISGKCLADFLNVKYHGLPPNLNDT